MHWTDNYVGREYIEGVQDCAELVEVVNREVFDRAINLPSERESNVFKQAQQLFGYLDDNCYRVDLTEAEDGDVVLMICRGRLSHSGVYCKIGRTHYVLHNVKTSGCTVFQKIDELPISGLKFEGVYRLSSWSDK